MRKNRGKIVYGRDDYHGRSAQEASDPHEGYDASGLSGDTAAHAAVDAVQTAAGGYELKPFRGRFLDKLSIDEIEDIEAGEETARQDASDQEFLSEMGFGSDGSTLK